MVLHGLQYQNKHIFKPLVDTSNIVSNERNCKNALHQYGCYTSNPQQQLENIQRLVGSALRFVPNSIKFLQGLLRYLTLRLDQ
jgi:hypothetical protein